MNRYNEMMRRKFAGFVCVAEKPDPYHHTTLRAFAIPGDDAIVGITGGGDAWVAQRSSIEREGWKAPEEGDEVIIRRRHAAPRPARRPLLLA